VRISSLFVHNFKNLGELNLTQLSGVNIITGRNASGKTNTLQSLYFLSTLSTQFKTYQQAVRFGADFFSVKAAVESSGSEKTLEVRYGPGRDVKLKVNGNVVAKKSDYIGESRVVNFAFEDIDLVRGSPGERRRALNILISQVNRGYLKSLQKYTAVLAQKNKLLSDAAGKKPDLALLETFNEQLCGAGAEVVQGRKDAAAFLTGAFDRAHRKISLGLEKASLEYKCSFDSSGDLKSAFGEKLKNLLPAEIARGASLVGPHKDDLIFLINGRDAKYYASDGQQRTLVFSFKLAEYRYMQEAVKDDPVILLDDVFYELDAERKAAVLEFFRPMPQLFIVSLEDEWVKKVFPDAKSFRISGGALTDAI